MAYTYDIALTGLTTGLTLSAQLVDTAGVNVGSAVTSGFSEVAATGNYLWHYAAFPDNFRGGVVFTAASVFKAFVAVNPEVAIQSASSGSGTTYVTLAEIRGEIGITVVGDTTDDTRLTAAAEAASRAIDNECGRRFYLDVAATAKYYTAEDGDYLRVDDIGSLTGLVIATDEDSDRDYDYTWASTDYDTEPDNAPGNGKPVTVIRTAPLGVYAFPRLRRGVRVTALWGWPTVPADIKKATMIEAVRLYRRRDAVFGQTGSPETGVMNLPALDPDVKRLIAPYRKMGIGGC